MVRFSNTEENADEKEGGGGGGEIRRRRRRRRKKEEEEDTQKHHTAQSVNIHTQKEADIKALPKSTKGSCNTLRQT